MPEVAGNYPVMLVCPAMLLTLLTSAPLMRLSVNVRARYFTGRLRHRARYHAKHLENDGWLSADSEGLYPGRAQYQRAGAG